MSTTIRPTTSPSVVRGRAAEGDDRALAGELHRRVRGEVRFDDGSRALYATDASNYRQTPIGVVVPRDSDDVEATIEICRRYEAPVLGRGGGTSLAGQCCNTAVVLDFSKYMNRVLEIDVENRRARVEPGLVLDHLRDRTRKHHLTFGPDPATHSHCTFGGMIGNNSCGVHSVMAGKTVDNVEELEILTYDGLRMRVGATDDEDLERILRAAGRRGHIYAELKRLRDDYADLIRERFPDIPRRVSGYNLEDLLPEKGFQVARALVGTEGTCATVLEATVRLVHEPPYRALLVIGYADAYTAADHVLDVLEHGPVGLEAFDDRLVSYIHKKDLHPERIQILPEGKGWLMAEFGGDTPEEADQRAKDAQSALERRDPSLTFRLCTSDEEDLQDNVWEARESGLGATAFVPGEPDTWPGWEDSAVPPEKLGGYLRDLRRLMDKHDYRCSYYGHFGQGCLHTRIDFELRTRQGVDKYRAFMEDAADLVIRYGGSLSGEHGDGQARGELLEKVYGPDLMEAFRRFKSIWDPQWKMNPGKVIDAQPLDRNLRLGADYRPPDVKTHFSFPEDNGSFAHATLRCVGVGKCRRTEGGVMCPSYMVTHEEKHTTRGRARLLFEMMQGETVTDGWQSEEVKEALDLCLACKGCKGDCPVNVDMATYKAEFLSHYYEGHFRPRSAWAMGLIFVWARLASLAPNVTNFVSRAPGVSRVTKWIGGVAPRRRMPKFARRTFLEWFRERAPRNIDAPQVLLWPDTFNNYFHPETARAAVEVLETAGYRVVVPEATLCCGRPLYDYGLLDMAKRKLLEILDSLRPHLEAGTPVVGLEPSCVAVFRDEMTSLLPHNEDARRLKEQTYLLSEFIAKHGEDFPLPELRRKALVHAHCHHHSLMGMDDEVEVLKRMGIDFELLDSGCCGMAGSFGFEEENYDVSMACGERVLLPRVREADPETLIIADGFSCQEQIEQATGRRGLHLAHVLQMALREERDGRPSQPLPERRQLRRASVDDGRLKVSEAAIVCSGALALGAAVAWLARRCIR
ncbi:MAG: FAD-binding protein [Planctomycetes bacterium]|nr:FAD-binding protein [Planctomycetota bacterium]